MEEGTCGYNEMVCYIHNDDNFMTVLTSASMDMFYFPLFAASVGAQAPPFPSKCISDEWATEPTKSYQQYNTPVCSSANCNGETDSSMITNSPAFLLPGLP